MRSTQQRRTACRIIWLPLLLAASLLAPGVVGADGEEAKVTNQLLAAGIDIQSVMTSGTDVTVEYSQPVAEVSTVIDVLQRIGTIFAAVAAEMPSTRTCIVVQHFDDGQIMEVSGIPADGVDFLGQRLTAQAFMAALEFRPLTRGPMLVPGACDPGGGENCSNCAECSCYPGETCDPANPQANARGCVAAATPANAHLVGSEYVCNDGFEWNAALSACVPVTQCPPHAFSFDGGCHCEPGYEWDSDGTECVPAQSTAPSGGSGPVVSGSDLLSKLKAMLDSLINWIKSLF
jgi:hypothetical protein